MAIASKPKPRRKWLFVLGLVSGIAAAVVAVNFVRSEKKIHHLVESPYSVADPQFTRTMGTLLGSPWFPATLLQNF